MANESSEPFPLLNTSAHPVSSDASSARRRRKSSGLGGEIRAGDTGAPSIGTTLDAIDGTPEKDKSTSGKAAKKGSKRRKARSLFKRFKAYAIKHTWLLPGILLVLFAIAYAINPTKSNVIHHFIFLSYELPPSPDAAPGTPTLYGKGYWDIAFVSFYTIVLSFTRELIMQEILRPLALYNGIRARGKQSRFMEQMYTAVYFGFLIPAGLYVMSRTPLWFFNTEGMYHGSPHWTHEADFKFYYLFQAAYWAQQAIVLILGLEARRKDFKELIGHHIVTLALIGLSYRFHFTYIGLPVYIAHDVSDFFLATSKSLNYVDHWLVGPYYVFFMGVWVYTRHYLSLKIIVSLFTEYPYIGPYYLDWVGGQFKCLLARNITFGLLAALQALNLFWLFYIFRIAYRFAFHNNLADDRSDVDESDAEEQQRELAEAKTEEEQLLLANGAANGANGKVKSAAETVSNGSPVKNSNSKSR